MRKYKHIISALAFALILAGVLNRVGFVLSDKSSYYKYHDFLEQPENDVLFVGTSHVLNGIDPMKIWEEFGITSYNLGTGGTRFAAQYWILRYALTKSSPEVVVIDTYGLEREEKIQDVPVGYLRTQLDWIQGPMRLQMLYDMFFSGPEGRQFHQKIQMLLPFYTDHNRWKLLKAKDFTGETTPWKGGGTGYAVASEDVDIPIADTQAVQSQTLSETYLRKMIELCRERGIRVVLMDLAFNCNETRSYLNRAPGIAQEYGLQFLNFAGEYAKLVNPKTDFSTGGENTHLNYSGAQKIAHFLGEFLRNDCAVRDRSADACAPQWNEYLQRHRAYREDAHRSLQDLASCLVSASDSDWQAVICWTEDTDIGQYESLIENLGLTIEKNYAGDLPRCAQNADGILQWYDSDGTAVLCPSDENGAPAQIQMILVSTETGQLVDAAAFREGEGQSFTRIA